MKSQDHKSATDDGKAKNRQGIKATSQVAHPILQLQQLVGNKAVTNMIQRHPEDSAKISNLNTTHNTDIHHLTEYVLTTRNKVSNLNTTHNTDIHHLTEYVLTTRNKVENLEQSGGGGTEDVVVPVAGGF